MKRLWHSQGHLISTFEYYINDWLLTISSGHIPSLSYVILLNHVNCVLLRVHTHDRDIVLSVVCRCKVLSMCTIHILWLWLSSGVIKVTKRIVVLGHRHNVYCTWCVWSGPVLGPVCWKCCKNRGFHHNTYIVTSCSAMAMLYFNV